MNKFSNVRFRYILSTPRAIKETTTATIFIGTRASYEIRINENIENKDRVLAAWNNHRGQRSQEWDQNY